MILGIGIDLLKVSRVKKILDKYCSVFLSKVFTKNEIDDLLEMREQGIGINKCAKKMKCGSDTIYKVINDPEHYYKLSGVTQSDKTYKEYKRELKIAEREQQKKLNAVKNSSNN